jgi:rRNA pseudouridine-1189 N-methylase Emg1 (Nep1/Mra1 family)
MKKSSNFFKIGRAANANDKLNMMELTAMTLTELLRETSPGILMEFHMPLALIKLKEVITNREI